MVYYVLATDSEINGYKCRYWPFIKWKELPDSDLIVIDRIKIKDEEYEIAVRRRVFDISNSYDKSQYNRIEFYNPVGVIIDYSIVEDYLNRISDSKWVTGESSRWVKSVLSTDEWKQIINAEKRYLE